MPRRFCLLVLLAVVALARPAVALTPSDALSHYGRQSWGTGNGLPQNTITAITQTPDGLLWIGSEEGLARFDGYGFVVYTTQNTPGLGGNAVDSLWVQGGQLLVGTGQQVLRFSRGRMQLSLAKKPEVHPPPIPSSIRAKVICTLTDRHGVLWIGTNKGLYRERGGVTETFPGSDTLASATILALFEDREGNLWVGTEEAGLQMAKDLAFTTFTADRIRCVFRDADGVDWLGTDGSGLKRISKGVLSTVSSQGGLSSDVVLSLAQSASGALLAGTPDGLSVLREKSIATQTSADGLPEDFVRSLFTDVDGSTWVGTRRGLAHIVGDRVNTYTESNGLGSDLVGTVVRDKAGVLWIGTFHGLSSFRAGSFTNYTVRDGLPGNVITDLFADPDGWLWIATQGGGLVRFRNGVFARPAAPKNIPQTLYGVTGDERGNLWLAAPEGIIRIRKLDFDRPGLSPAVFGTADGLKAAQCSGGGHPAVWTTASGDIWFATVRGGALLSKDHIAAADVAPTVVLETVTVDDAPFDPESVQQVGPEHARVAFQYAGINLSDPQRVVYQYRLQGFDGEWIDAGTRRTAFYTNLGPGQYKFHVRARNARGLWSQTAVVYPFRVLPHFYQTWWFRLAAVLCFLALIYAVYLWRVRRVRSEFRAVLQERTRIAREIHDTLAQGFAGVSVQLEVVSRLLSASPVKAREHLDQARALARTCLEDARRSIWELRSQSAEREDLATRFAHIVRAASQSGGLSVQFQVHGTYRPVDSKVEDEILRIGQEAITNAIRHSGAETVKADLTYSVEHIRLTVSDNGRGIAHILANAPPPDSHYGLTGMRERAQSIDAVFAVESRRDTGTTISVEARLR